MRTLHTTPSRRWLSSVSSATSSVSAEMPLEERRGDPLEREHGLCAAPEAPSDARPRCSACPRPGRGSPRAPARRGSGAPSAPAARPRGAASVVVHSGLARSRRARAARRHARAAAACPAPSRRSHRPVAIRSSGIAVQPSPRAALRGTRLGPTCGGEPSTANGDRRPALARRDRHGRHVRRPRRPAAARPARAHGEAAARRRARAPRASPRSRSASAHQRWSCTARRRSRTRSSRALRPHRARDDARLRRRPAHRRDSRVTISTTWTAGAARGDRAAAS